MVKISKKMKGGLGLVGLVGVMYFISCPSLEQSNKNEGSKNKTSMTNQIDFIETPNKYIPRINMDDELWENEIETARSRYGENNIVYNDFGISVYTNLMRYPDH